MTTEITQSLTNTQLPSLAELAELPANSKMAAINQAKQITTTGQVYCGQALINLKDSVSHGEYIELLEQHGWKSRTARRYMQFAEFAAKVESTRPEVLPMLDMTQWMTVQTALDEATLTQLINGDTQCGITIDDIQDKSSRELKVVLDDFKKSTNAELKQKDGQIADLEKKLETQQLENCSLRDALDARTEIQEYPDFVVEVRDESFAASQKAMLCIDDMEQISKNLLDFTTLNPVADPNIAVATMLTHARAMLARCQRAVSSIEDTWPDYVGNEEAGGMLFSEQEVDSAVQSRELMIRDHEQEKRIRENQRQAAKPRGRGRPKKQSV